MILSTGGTVFVFRMVLRMIFIVGGQQDIFDLRTNQPIDGDRLKRAGAWHSERSAKFENKSKWSDYAWIRKYNPADYLTATLWKR